MDFKWDMIHLLYRDETESMAWSAVYHVKAIKGTQISSGLPNIHLIKTVYSMCTTAVVLYYLATKCTRILL